jgi:hypothetical protein
MIDQINVSFHFAKLPLSISCGWKSTDGKIISRTSAFSSHCPYALTTARVDLSDDLNLDLKRQGGQIMPSL